MKRRYISKTARIKKYNCIVQSYIYASGVKACYKYDSRVRQIFDEMPDGYDLVVGVLEHRHAAVITKLSDGLHCKIVVDYVPSNKCIQIMFKNMDSCTLVLKNYVSFFQAYAQGRFVTYGDNAIAVKFIKAFMIVQCYLSSISKRKAHIKDALPLEVKPAVIKSRVLFRGLL